MARPEIRLVDQNFDALEMADRRFDGPPGGGDNGGMDARLTALETRLDAVLSTLATKTDVAEVRVDIQRSVNETHKWMIATVIGLFLGFGGLFLAMSNALKTSPQVATQPVVINLPGSPK